MRLMRKLVRKLGFAPTTLLTDEPRSYGAAFRDLGLAAWSTRGLPGESRPPRGCRNMFNGRF
jgi:hypothetical protein